MHKHWGLYTFFNVLHLIFAYRKSSITKVIEIENGKEQKRLYITSHCVLLQFFGSCTKQVPAERKDSIDNGSNIIKIVGNHSYKGAANNALDVLSGQAAGVNVTSNGLDRMAMLNSVRVRGTTSIIGGNDPLVLIDGVASDVLTLSTIYVLLIGQ